MFRFSKTATIITSKFQCIHSAQNYKTRLTCRIVNVVISVPSVVCATIIGATRANEAAAANEARSGIIRLHEAIFVVGPDGDLV